MIRKLIGTIDELEEDFFVLMVGKVGYQIFANNVALGKLSKNGLAEEVTVYIHTHVREDQFLLYGFDNKDDLALFELLISISGVGPKAALNILSIASPASIKTAVLKNDITILTKVSGIGKKTAERIVLELQNKIKQIEISETEEQEAIGGQEVLEALIAMGYSSFEAREALKSVPEEITDESEKIRLALKAMKKN